MCGIAGMQGSFSPELLSRMSARIAHRGPDGSGYATFAGLEGQGICGLAHRRLAIIDLSAAGKQPMTVSCECCGCRQLEDIALTFNGEIYNFRELRDELVARGHRFQSRTDSEVLIHLYAEHGLEMLTRLNGIFAFAIRDGRERGRPEGVAPGDLFIARDPIGVKPLYYSALPEGVLFASELKALLEHPGLVRDIDFSALHSTMAYLWTPAPKTMLRHVKKLRPGFAIVVHGGRIAREWSYYDLPYGREPMSDSCDAIALQLREKVAAAVQRQLIADVPIGAFLSGGLDSSSIVAMMRLARPETPITCYSIGFADGSAEAGTPEDLPFARRVAGHLGVDLRPILVDSSIITNLERMLYQLDEPQADPAPINALLIAEQAKRDGYKVLMSGAGGDDMFSGYRRHMALRFERYWSWLPHAMRRGVATVARKSATGEGAFAGRFTRRAVKALSYADEQSDRRLVSYFWWSTDQLRRSLYSPALAAELGGDDVATPLLESFARIGGERDPLNRMLYLEGKHFLADHNLNYTDKMGMAAGVEIRVPLLDLDLVDFATRIPSHMKQRGAVGKAIFKTAMEPFLPRDVIYRRKTGFGAPLRRWLAVELRDMVEDTLSAETLRARGFFDPASVRRLIDLDRAGKVDGTYTIFSMMCMELWCRIFVDGRGLS